MRQVRPTPHRKGRVAAPGPGKLTEASVQVRTTDPAESVPRINSVNPANSSNRQHMSLPSNQALVINRCPLIPVVRSDAKRCGSDARGPECDRRVRPPVLEIGRPIVPLFSNYFNRSPVNALTSLTRKRVYSSISKALSTATL